MADLFDYISLSRRERLWSWRHAFRANIRIRRMMRRAARERRRLDRKHDRFESKYGEVLRVARAEARSEVWRMLDSMEVDTSHYTRYTKEGLTDEGIARPDITAEEIFATGPEWRKINAESTKAED